MYHCKQIKVPASPACLIILVVIAQKHFTASTICFLQKLGWVGIVGITTRVAESEVFGRSWIPNNTRSWSQTFLFESGSSIGSFSHHTPKLGIPVEMVQFLVKILLKQRILAVYHDFHWVLVATKFLTAKLHSLYASALQPFCHRGTPDILSRLSWNPINTNVKNTNYL